MATVLKVTDFFAGFEKNNTIIKNPKKFLDNVQSDINPNLLNAIKLLYSRKYDNHDFTAPRAYQIAKEEYDKTPDNLLNCYVLASASISVGDFDEAKILFEKVIDNIKFFPKEYEDDIYFGYAKNLYFKGNYKKSYSILENFSDNLEKNKNFSDLLTIIKICFENSDINSVHRFFEKMTYLSKTGDDLLPAVPYIIFSYLFAKHDIGFIVANTVVRQTLNFFARKTGLKELNKQNINKLFELLREVLVFKDIKTELTESEKEGMRQLRELANIYVNYPEKEIIFEKEISFQNKKLIMNVVRFGEKEFWGQIQDNLTADGNTLEELNENMTKLLESHNLSMIEYGSEIDKFIRNFDAIEVTDEIKSELDEIFSEAISEFLEFQQEINFPRNIFHFIQKYENISIKAINLKLNESGIPEQLKTQVLSYLGEVNNSNTLEERLNVLVDRLINEHSEIRDGAILGLSSLEKDDILAITDFQFKIISTKIINALDRETNKRLKKNLKTTLEYIEKWKKLKHDLDVKRD